MHTCIHYIYTHENGTDKQMQRNANKHKYKYYSSTYKEKDTCKC